MTNKNESVLWYVDTIIVTAIIVVHGQQIGTALLVFM